MAQGSDGGGDAGAEVQQLIANQLSIAQWARTLSLVRPGPRAAWLLHAAARGSHTGPSTTALLRCTCAETAPMLLCLRSPARSCAASCRRRSRTVWTSTTGRHAVLRTAAAVELIQRVA